MTTMNGIVETIPYLCKRCYSCVRECPAIAIRVEAGQAVVISERCISCGHCITVCSQNAKQIKNDVSYLLEELLYGDEEVIAMLAPSFPAAFPDTYNKLPTVLRTFGFSKVCETAFGADLISKDYKNLINDGTKKTIISSACPAVFTYIEKYKTDLIPNLAGIVSPMIAMGRYLKTVYGENVKVVFIGPCIAKKNENLDSEVEGVVDAVLTFSELQQMFKDSDIDLNEYEDSNLDPPYGNLGKTYSLPGGLLKTADIQDDLLAKEIIVVEGRNKFEELIDELSHDKINAKFIDVLFCDGCISGPGMGSDLNYYSRREKVINYTNDKLKSVDKQVWKSDIYNSRDINMSRSFTGKPVEETIPDEEDIKRILAQTNKFTKQDELNCSSCGYKTCRDYAIAIAKGLAENEMCLPYLIETMEKAYSELENTQQQLHTAEKLASIGQLAAGVAHEINNPLGTILLYSSLLKKTLEKRLNDPQCIEDIELISEETNRCKNIVANLLNFARQGKLKMSKFDVTDSINTMIKTLRINPAYKDISFSVESNLNENSITGDNDQIKQVLLNILTNAAESLEDSKTKRIDVKIFDDNEYITIQISDTGCGIPKENLGKLFTPFFTTKKIGKGTGLGLAITYGIIKMHKGDIKVTSEENKGSTFSIKLPLNLKSN